MLRCDMHYRRRGPRRFYGSVTLDSSRVGRDAGRIADAVKVDISALVVDEIRLVGSRCGPLHAALRLLEKRLVDPLPLFDARFPLQQGVDALRQAVEPGKMKVLVHP